MLSLPKRKREKNDITTIRTSLESHVFWEKPFHKNLLYFRINADFEVLNEIDKSEIVKETTNIYKQNPILNGYYIISELEEVLKSGRYKSSLGYDNVDLVY